MNASYEQMTKEQIIGRMMKILQGMSRDRLLILLHQLEKTPMRWNREHPRKTCMISVDYDTDDYSNRKTIQNLSASGAYILAGESFTVGQDITLWFSIDQDKENSVKIPAKVVRRDTNGIGVKFENLTREQYGLLKTFEKMDYS